MNARYILLLIVALLGIVLAIVLLIPVPKQSQQPPIVVGPTPIPMAQPTPPTPIPVEGTPSLEQPTAIASAPTEPTETEIAVAPTPTLTAEEIEKRVRDIIAQFEASVLGRNEILTEALVKELIALGGPALDYLANYVYRHPNNDVREYAANALAQMGTPEALGVLITAIHQETDPQIKENLRTILKTTLNPAGITVAIDGLAQRDLLWLHEDSLALLLQLEADGSAQALIDGYLQQIGLTDEAKERFLNAISSLKDPFSLTALQQQFESQETPDALRFASADGLAGIGTPDAVQYLLDRAQNTTQTDVRQKILESVSNVTNKEAIPILRAALESNPSPDVRAAAARALVIDANEPSLAWMNERYERETSEIVRQAIASSLQRIAAQDF